jgi:hypothetical protein
MLKREANDIAGTLSDPSKMPGYSYGLPAEECQVGGRLQRVPGSTCAECYAMKGFYQKYARTIKPAQYKRLDSLTHPLWVDAMVKLIERTTEPWFRWHDSGDVQSLQHLVNIAEVARRTPAHNQWLPTREYRYVDQYRQQFGEFPPNLVVRLSAHMVDGPPPKTDLPTSTVVTDPDKATCRAFTRKNTCGPCRKCWNHKVKNVSYLEH